VRDHTGGFLLALRHLYYHPAATETKYSGSAQVGFFDRPHEIDSNITVKPGDPPGLERPTPA
jgi:hypothetical protein